MAIIQGSNLPLILTFPFDIENFSIIEVGLYDNLGKELKHWNSSVWRKSGNVLYCDLTEAETLSYKPGMATVEVKYVDEDGNTQFFKPRRVCIAKRYDKTRMVG